MTLIAAMMLEAFVVWLAWRFFGAEGGDLALVAVISAFLLLAAAASLMRDDRRAARRQYHQADQQPRQYLQRQVQMQAPQSLPEPEPEFEYSLDVQTPDRSRLNYPAEWGAKEFALLAEAEQWAAEQHAPNIQVRQVETPQLPAPARRYLPPPPEPAPQRQKQLPPPQSQYRLEDGNVVDAEWWES